MTRRRARAILFIIATLLGSLGCGRIPSAAPSNAAPPAVFDPAALEAAEPEAAWSQRYPRAVAVAVMPDGDGVAVAGSVGPGGQAGVELLAPDGTRLWQYPLAAEPSARVTVAALEPRADRVVVVVTDGDGKGAVLALTLAGRPVWRHEVSSPVSVRVSPDGTRTALIDHGDGHLTLLGENGADVATVTVAPGATAEFLDGGYLVVNDRAQVLALGPDGKVLRRLPVDESLRRQLAVHPDGRRLAVATSGSQDAAYLLGLDPDARRVSGPDLQVPLYPGGRNRLRFSPEGDVLYVFDVGDRAGLYAVSMDDMTVAWRLLTRRPGWTLAELAAGAEGLLARYVAEDPEGGEQVVRIHPDGKPALRLRLRPAGGWFLPRASDRLLVAVQPSPDGRGSVVRAYRLEPLSASR